MTRTIGLTSGCALLLAAALLATGASRGTAKAEPAPQASTIGRVAVDVNADGNTATSLGPTDSCRRVEVGAEVTVDVIVDAIPADRPMTAMQFELLYGQSVVNVVQRNVDMLLASNADYNPAVNLTDRVPDSDGDFLVAVADFTATGPDSGPGVLLRAVLKAVGPGLANLSPANVQIRDTQNEKVPIDSLAAAYLAVGQDCPSETPPVLPPPEEHPEEGTPAPQQSPGSAESPGSQQSPGPGASGSAASPGASGAASGSATPNAGSSAADDDGGGGIGAWIIAPVAGILVAAAGAYLALRRFVFH